MNLNLCSLLNICVKMEQENRVVVLIDMDCFYCQVEEKLTPELSGKPIAVVQYNPWKGGGIIAVNYVARAMGVTRHMRGDEAKEKCPEIQLPSVPCFRGKADISKYRDAGKDVAKVLQKFTPLLERASIDEAYLDITAPVQERLRTHNVNTITADIIPNTYALGYEGINDFISDIHNYGSDSMDFDYEHAKQLLVGALIVTEIRAAVYEKTGYRCSAGIAHNKILAKLVCGMNKPNKQTILPKHSVNILFSTLSVKKVKHLGGKFGDTVCDVLKIKNMSQLQSFSEKELQTRFDEKNGTWLYNIARGIDLEPVQARFNPKSIGCCKQFRGKNALPDLDNLKKWLTDLGDEIDDRLEKDALENNRTPKQMVVSFSTYLPDGRDVSSSRSYNFLPDDDLCGELFFKKALELVLETTEGKFRGEESNRKLKAPIKFLGISVGKFEDNCVDSKKTKKILDYFTAGSSKEITNKSNETKNTRDKSLESTNKSSKNEGKEFILQRFFNTTGIVDQSKDNKDNIFERAQENYVNELVAQSTLEKQESFFAKFLSTGLNTAANDRVESDKHFVENKQSNDILKPSTPTCEVVNCGENSNDTEYSGSTINMEINKSIALFEDDDPQDLERISKIRNLLNSTMIEREEGNNEITTENSSNEDISKVEESDQTIPAIENTYNIFTAEETFECSECRKAVAISNFDTHADYHLALKLREEERHQARLERIDKSSKASSEHNKKPGGLDADNSVPQIRHNETNKTETSSIANFLVKIDNNLPSEICSECGKKVLKEKFLEHLDFHEAQKLNRELNKKPISNAFTGNSAKRKRKSMSPVKKLKVPCKSIDSFFKQ